MKFAKVLAHGSALAITLLFSAQGSAAVSCPGTIGGDTGLDRQVSLTNETGAIACFDFGAGNDWDGSAFEETKPIKNPLTPNLLYKNDGKIEPSGATFPGNFSGLNGTSGSFAFTVPATGDYYLLMKFGGGSGEPDWIAFKVSGAVSANWTFIPSDSANALSHYSLWGAPFTEVPEPTTLALMGLGLLGMGYRLRRRQNV